LLNDQNQEQRLQALETLVHELVVELAAGKGDPLEFLQALRNRLSEPGNRDASLESHQEIARHLDRVEEQLAEITA
jgi:hypothetical protein